VDAAVMSAPSLFSKPFLVLGSQGGWRTRAVDFHVVDRGTPPAGSVGLEPRQLVTVRHSCGSAPGRGWRSGAKPGPRDVPDSPPNKGPKL